MSAYGHLAGFYDLLTEDVDYPSFADYYEGLITADGRKPEIVLDLACGTGNLTRALAERGYDLIGTDASAEMLSAAREQESQANILYLQQEMTELDLYGTVDAAVCCLDGINYVPRQELEQVFRRVFLFLVPGGVFSFDLNTVEKLESLDGQLFADEREDVLCLWRCEYDPEERECYYDFDLFVRQGGLWNCRCEEHVEYAYSADEVERALQAAGFTQVRVFGDRSSCTPQPGEQRIFFSAVKPNEGVE